MSRYGKTTSSTSAVVHLFNLINLGMALAVLMAWPNYADALADPMSVISGEAAPIRPSVLEYPYFLFWLLPIAGVCGAYIAKAMEIDPLAKFFAVFPALLTLTSCAWLYYFAGYWNN